MKHIDDITTNVKDYFVNSNLHTIVLGDEVAIIVAEFLGGSTSTRYSEY